MNLIFLGGSLRPESLNRRLMNYLARETQNEGHSVQIFEGEDLRLPLYEDGLPTPGPVDSMMAALLRCLLPQHSVWLMDALAKF